MIVTTMMEMKKLLQNILFVLLKLMLLMVTKSVTPCSAINPVGGKNCFNFTDHNASGVFPRNPFIYFNERVCLNCTLVAQENHQIPPDAQLHFVRQSTQNSSQTLKLLMISNVSSGNGLTILACDDEITREEKEKQIDYTCHLHVPNCKNEDVVGFDFVRFDLAPSLNESISCVVDDDNSMKCTFSLGHYYRYQKSLNVTMEFLNMISNVKWEYTRLEDNWYICPSYFNGTHAECVFKEDTFIPGYHRFRITITNIERNDTLLKAFSDTTDFIRLAPPKGLNVTYKNSTSVGIQWNVQKKWINQEIHLLYCTFPDQICKTSVARSMDAVYRDTPITLTHLRPYTKYKVRLKKIALNINKTVGYCSDETELEVKTLPDLPLKNPIVWPGFFSCLDENCNIHRLYWNNLRDVDVYGEIIAYNITVNDLKNKTAHSIYLKGKKQFFCDIDSVNPESLYEIEVRLENSVGYSKAKPGRLFLFPVNQRPKLTNSLVVKGVNGSLAVLHWKTSNDPSVINYSLVWCKELTNGACGNDLQAKVVLKNDSFLRIGFLETESFSDYKYGISTEKYDESGTIFSSGIYWACAECYSCKNCDLPKALNVTDHVTNETMQLTWKPYSYRKEMPILIGYLINTKLCRLDNICKTNSLKVNASTDSVVIKLNKTGEYEVDVQAIFEGERYGPASEKKRHTITMLSQSLPQDTADMKVVIIVICLVTLLFVIVVIFSVCKAYKKCKKIDKELTVDKPPAPFSENRKNDIKQSNGFPKDRSTNGTLKSQQPTNCSVSSESGTPSLPNETVEAKESDHLLCKSNTQAVNSNSKVIPKSETLCDIEAIAISIPSDKNTKISTSLSSNSGNLTSSGNASGSKNGYSKLTKTGVPSAGETSSVQPSEKTEDPVSNNFIPESFEISDFKNPYLPINKEKALEPNASGGENISLHSDESDFLMT